jgi:hypothetical protein
MHISIVLEAKHRFFPRGLTSEGIPLWTTAHKPIRSRLTVLPRAATANVLTFLPWTDLEHATILSRGWICVVHPELQRRITVAAQPPTSDLSSQREMLLASEAELRGQLDVQQRIIDEPLLAKVVEFKSMKKPTPRTHLLCEAILSVFGIVTPPPLKPGALANAIVPPTAWELAQKHLFINVHTLAQLDRRTITPEVHCTCLTLAALTGVCVCVCVCVCACACVCVCV